MQRVAMTESQRAQYEMRVAAQEERLSQQNLARDRKIAELRVAAEMKRQVIERAQQQQQANEANRKAAILAAEHSKQVRLDQKAEQEAEIDWLIATHFTRAVVPDWCELEAEPQAEPRSAPRQPPQPPPSSGAAESESEGLPMLLLSLTGRAAPARIAAPPSGRSSSDEG